MVNIGTVRATRPERCEFSPCLCHYQRHPPPGSGRQILPGPRSDAGRKGESRMLVRDVLHHELDADVPQILVRGPVSGVVSQRQIERVVATAGSWYSPRSSMGCVAAARPCRRRDACEIDIRRSGLGVEEVALVIHEAGHAPGPSLQPNRARYLKRGRDSTPTCSTPFDAPDRVWKDLDLVRSPRWRREPATCFGEVIGADDAGIEGAEALPLPIVARLDSRCPRSSAIRRS